MNRACIASSSTAARSLGALLALALLIGSVPQTIGVTLISVSDRPTLSLDLCHPLQTALAGTIGVLARPAPIELQPRLREFRLATVATAIFLYRLPDAPERPPPEARA